ncbi:unnamed protein product [Effrenium voratum]|nr:unnamed protein product [Effrenium voratum]
MRVLAPWAFGTLPCKTGSATSSQTVCYRNHLTILRIACLVGSWSLMDPTPGLTLPAQQLAQLASDLASERRGGRLLLPQRHVCRVFSRAQRKKYVSANPCLASRVDLPPDCPERIVHVVIKVEHTYEAVQCLT